MNPPIAFRKHIPLFYNKTAVEYQKDQYEKYDGMVLRQSALHLADELWGYYPLQAVFDFAQPFYPDQSSLNILEIGCGVGRWIATMAQRYPQATCWGIDYSYQMLKRAHEFWIHGQQIIIDRSNKGFPQTLEVKGHQLNNLSLGLAKANRLPFSDNSQDLVLSSFLFDRLKDPYEGLLEMHRILKSGGKMILITPLNFNQPNHWERFFPSVKIHQLLNQIGFDIQHWNKEIIIEEPLDARGNVVVWKCVGFVGIKRA